MFFIQEAWEDDVPLAPHLLSCHCVSHSFCALQGPSLTSQLRCSNPFPFPFSCFCHSIHRSFAQQNCSKLGVFSSLVPQSTSKDVEAALSIRLVTIEMFGVLTMTATVSALPEISKVTVSFHILILPLLKSTIIAHISLSGWEGG